MCLPGTAADPPSSAADAGRMFGRESKASEEKGLNQLDLGAERRDFSGPGQHSWLTKERGHETEGVERDDPPVLLGSRWLPQRGEGNRLHRSPTQG